MDEMFYGTLPADTQDFTQVLRGVGRNIGDIARGVSYYPYDLIGAPVDIINMALTPMGLGSQQPVMGSDYLRNIGKSLGLAQDPTGSIPETVSRIGAGFINPAAGARAVGQAGNLVTRGANISADKLVQMITQNPRATAMGVVDETAMPFMQAAAPRTPAPSLLEPTKSDIGFYSQLEAATIPLQNKGTGDQYLAQISKTAGVKPEEIQWTGLDEFLKGKKSVTKDEILNYLNTNRVDVKEVRLSGYGEKSPVFAEYFPDTNKFHVFTNDLRLQGLYDTAEEADAFVKQYNASIPYGPSKFEKYVLPGGENYREILLTLPEDSTRVKNQLDALDAEAKRLFDAGDPRWTEVSAQRGELLRQQSRGTYRSTHFDQPNILAHMRVNDRVVDGKKTLFIEEIQSDWHQAGRKKGYGPQTETTVEAYYETKSGQRIPIGFGKTKAEAEASIDVGWKDTVDVKYETIERKVSEGVPDAPFKTSWHELTLKRAIQEASEKGYDQIAFTTGKTQVERYPEALRQVADDISWRAAGTPESGNRFIEIKKSGNTVLQAQVNNRGIVTSSSTEEAVGKPIEDLIGKPMGQQVIAEPFGNIKGEQFTVGGKGMEGFYDNILPKSLDKLAKKFDAKVGKTFIEGERTRDASGIPSMYPEKIEVWQMDITPKMRESVTTKGQPLFAVPAIGAGLLGAGMVQDEQMY